MQLNFDPEIRPPDTEANSVSGHISWPDSVIPAKLGIRLFFLGFGISPEFIQAGYQGKLGIQPYFLAGYRCLPQMYLAKLDIRPLFWFRYLASRIAGSKCTS